MYVYVKDRYGVPWILSQGKFGYRSFITITDYSHLV